MTTGALIFAFNNEKTDYVQMATWSAKRIREYLSIPVAIVTDTSTPDLLQCFEHVIEATPQTGGSRYFEDYNDSVSWHNAGRTDAYSLSPWDQTLVLDADYVVCCDDLKQVLASSQDFLAFRNAYNLADPETPFLNTFGRNQFPMWWATVMMFRKSNTAQYIFDCMEMIKNNWQHYRDLYGITERNYRNDYSLSIALGIVSGHTMKVTDIPWSLASVMPDTELSLKQDAAVEYWNINYTRKGGSRTTTIVGMDFHAMGKKHLGDIIEAS